MNRYAKAERLVKQRRVRILHQSRDAILADVRGDSATYRVCAVLPDPGTIVCTCPSLLDDCSHVRAVYLYLQGVPHG